jgi:N-acetylmuramoyl-L-alanine amidase
MRDASTPQPDSPEAVKLYPSPNHGERKGGARADCIILHYTGMADASSALLWLCNPLSEVSCHYFVFEDGRIWQLVPEARRAWHAGKSCWQGERDMNSRSIGIEIVNPGHDVTSPTPHDYPPFPDEQIDAVIRLVRDVATRWQIAPRRILAHSDIAPGRKIDPGENFPWQKLAAAGVGHYAPPAPIVDGAAYRLGDEGPLAQGVQSLFARYGYDMPITGIYDAQTKAVVEAFQRHFRPERVDGVADVSTLKTLRALL